jgi:hypothetical protein
LGDNWPMSRQESGQPPAKNQTEAERRNARRAAALRENLRRRKQGVRARTEPGDDGRADKQDT